MDIIIISIVWLQNSQASIDTIAPLILLTGLFLWVVCSFALLNCLFELSLPSVGTDRPSPEKACQCHLKKNIIVNILAEEGGELYSDNLGLVQGLLK